MLRRFNSLIKGPKAWSDEEATEHVSLRPARSVDSSLFVSPQRGGVVAPVSPLNPLLARRSEDGQTSLSVTVPHGVARQHHDGERERGARAFVIGRVPEERSWKEGYEQANLYSPGTPQEQYEPGEKPSDHGGATTEPLEFAPAGEAHGAVDGAQALLPIPAPRQLELPRISRAPSDDVVAAHDAVVDIPDSHPGNGVDLADLRKSVAATGPGRTISSWSTDSAADHCRCTFRIMLLRFMLGDASINQSINQGLWFLLVLGFSLTTRICQQHSEEPLIELGCMCRGEMAKSHKSCIEMWFKNKGTNKCEVCQ